MGHMSKSLEDGGLHGDDLAAGFLRGRSGRSARYLVQVEKVRAIERSTEPFAGSLISFVQRCIDRFVWRRPGSVRKGLCARVPGDDSGCYVQSRVPPQARVSPSLRRAT
jgi:hypothetical protein